MKKIISFSLWGEDPKYLEGAIENVKIAKELFKTWTCRFYIHKEVPFNYVKELGNLGAEVIIVDESISTGMLWRFRVLSDKTIDRAIVRDTDGRLSIREKNCIKDWIRSNKEFHIIRDNVMHGTRIMGGIWGCTGGLIKRLEYDTIVKAHDFLNTPDVYAYDQDFLALKIYPLIKDNVCIHDEYGLYKDEVSRRIPHMREGTHYIGEPIEL
jgi:hypothetical protein